MINIHVDSQSFDDERRGNLYRGDLYVYAPRQVTRQLCNLARTMAAEAFHPHDPRQAQFHPLPRCHSILAGLVGGYQWGYEVIM